MTLLYVLCAILIPFLLLSSFTRYVNKQFSRLPPGVPFTLADLGFPDDAGSLSAHFQDISQSLSIYYKFLVPCAILFLLLPSFGRILLYLVDALMWLFCFGRYIGLSIAKRAYRSVARESRKIYAPVVCIYRALLIHKVFLFVVFNLFFDLVFLN